MMTHAPPGKLSDPSRNPLAPILNLWTDMTAPLSQQNRRPRIEPTALQGVGPRTRRRKTSHRIPLNGAGPTVEAYGRHTCAQAAFLWLCALANKIKSADSVWPPYVEPTN